MAKTHLGPSKPFALFHSFWVSVRPKTLSASVSPVLLAFALSGPSPSFALFLPTVLCALFMQMGANLANDYYDRAKGVDRHRLGPMRPVQLGKLSPDRLKAFFLLSFALAFFLGLTLVWVKGLGLLVLGVLCLLAAYLYTGGPYPLSHHMMGEVAAFIFFGPVAILGALWIFQGFFDVHDFFLSLPSGFMAALMMGLNNQRDALSDRRAEKYTPASLWGEEWGRRLNLFFLSWTFLLPFLFCWALGLGPSMFLPLLPFALFMPRWRRLLKGAKERELIPILEASGRYFFLYNLSLALGVVLSRAGGY
ncbi:MAG: 1,4-dihydroxy-2-naphthoate octaprenyltransferase [Bacteriovoracales bacterium]|nr:1,4-dihydroxy-2-naphthoate octaprenyltransferase [Bacteriovoracales bacterium]